MKQYLVGHLWDDFVKEFPVLSRIPVLRHWAFGVYLRAYFAHKIPHN